MDAGQTLPYCSPNDTALQSSHVVPIVFSEQRYMLGGLYLVVWALGFFPQCLCLYSICHKQHLKYPCYVLMMFVSVLDLSNLTTCVLTAGIFSLLDIHHCNSGYWVIIIGYVTLWLWFAYCGAAMILALNRVLEFSSKHTSELLFDGRRCWLWVFVSLGYACLVQCTVSKPFYYYNPTEGVFNFFTLHTTPTNVNHIVNNMFTFLFVSVSYTSMRLLLKIKMRQGVSTVRAVSSLEAKLSIQTFVVGILAAFATIGYIGMSYFLFARVPLTGALGECLWASVHRGSAYIYLTMNKSMRTTALKLLSVYGGTKVTTLTATPSFVQHK
uniref:G_PROTEIN_RECEP_F1_2 domain-containing protein n=1 Tax=Steinernema glaseri TaxID=37863 RepID=A0A1I7Z1U4_9BILA